MPCRCIKVRALWVAVVCCGGLLLLQLAGCASVAPLAPATALPAAAVLLERLDQSRLAVETMKGLARVEVESPRGSQSFTQVLLLQRPDRIRAEVLGLFGQPALVLVSDGQQMSVALPAAGQYYRGAASADNLLRFTGLPMAPAQLVTLLLGAQQLPPFTLATVVATAEGVELHLQNQADTQIFRFDAQQRLLGASYWQHGEAWLQLGYDDFDAAGIARTRSFVLPRAAFSARLRFSELTINQPLAAERFVLALPAGVAVQSL